MKTKKQKMKAGAKDFDERFTGVMKSLAGRKTDKKKAQEQIVEESIKRNKAVSRKREIHSNDFEVIGGETIRPAETPQIVLDLMDKPKVGIIRQIVTALKNGLDALRP